MFVRDVVPLAFDSRRWLALRTIGGAGHLLAMTHPAELAGTVEVWLTGT